MLFFKVVRLSRWKAVCRMFIYFIRRCYFKLTGNDHEKSDWRWVWHQGGIHFLPLIGRSKKTMIYYFATSSYLAMHYYLAAWYTKLVLESGFKVFPVYHPKLANQLKKVDCFPPRLLAIHLYTNLPEHRLSSCNVAAHGDSRI